MTLEAVLLLVEMGAGAGLLLVHLVLLFHVLENKQVSRLSKLFAFLPPATPVVAWRSGAHTSVLGWLACVALYTTLRILERIT